MTIGGARRPHVTTPPTGGGGGGTVTPPPAGAAPLTIGAYTRVFFDDFTTDVAEGAMINSSGVGLGAYSAWRAYANGTNDTEANVGHTNSGYNNSTISCSGGAMRIRCHKDAASGRDWGAAPYPTLPGVGNNYQTYGRVETRARSLSNKQGFKTAWERWARSYDLPSSDPNHRAWPTQGETDFPEGNLNGGIDINMHYYNATAGNQQDHTGTTKRFTDGWHTFVDEWSPNQWKFYIDGVLIATSTGTKVPPVSMRWIMQTETVLSTSGRPVLGEDSLMEIDYVAMYSYTP